MSNYTKATNFTAKDTLPTGDSNKIVKGTEIDTEFTAVASAISSKADTNSPTFTGTPTCATSIPAGTNNTQLATTAFVTTAITAATGSLGTMSSQDDDAVDITGGTLDAVTITDATVNSVTVGTNGSGTKTISSSSPTGGSSGDVWYKV